MLNFAEYQVKLKGSAVIPLELETTVMVLVLFLPLKKATKLKGDSAVANCVVCCC